MSDDGIDETLTAGHLVAIGECSAACLVACGDDSGKCSCRCGGRFHGALVDVRVADTPQSWWKLAGNVGWSEMMLSSLPVAHTIAQQNRIYRRSRERDEAFGVVESHGKRWDVVWDGITMSSRSPESTWPRRESRLLNRFVDALLVGHRISFGGYAPCERLSLGAFKTLFEARVVLAVIGECYVGNPCGVVRAIEVLEGRKDPVELGLNPASSYPDRLSSGWTEPRVLAYVD